MKYCFVNQLVEDYLNSLIKEKPLQNISLVLCITDINPLILWDNLKTALQVIHMQNQDVEFKQKRLVHLQNVKIQMSWQKDKIVQIFFQCSRLQVNFATQYEQNLQNVLFRAKLMNDGQKFTFTTRCQKLYRILRKKRNHKQQFGNTNDQNSLQDDLISMSVPNQVQQRKSRQTYIKGLSSCTIKIMQKLLIFVDKKDLLALLEYFQLQKQNKSLVILTADVPNLVFKDQGLLVSKQKYDSFNIKFLQENMQEQIEENKNKKQFITDQLWNLRI